MTAEPAPIPEPVPTQNQHDQQDYCSRCWDYTPHRYAKATNSWGCVPCAEQADAEAKANG